MNSDLLENLRLELRRGCLVLAVLAKLRSEYHGYALAKALKESGLDDRRKHPVSPPAPAGKPEAAGQSLAGRRQTEQTLLPPFRGRPIGARLAAGGVAEHQRSD